MGRGAGQDRCTTLLSQSSKNSTTCMSALLLSVCIHSVIEKSGSQQVFKCPTCEQKMNIPVGGASGLPQNLDLGSCLCPRLLATVTNFS